MKDRFDKFTQSPNWSTSEPSYLCTTLVNCLVRLWFSELMIVLQHELPLSWSVDSGDICTLSYHSARDWTRPQGFAKVTQAPVAHTLQVTVSDK